MPLRRFINDAGAFTPADLKSMGIAFDAALAKLGVKDRADSINELVAKRIISFARQGERDPERLCEHVLSSLRGSPTAAAR